MNRYSIRPVSNKTNRYVVYDNEIEPGQGPVVAYRGTEQECREFVSSAQAALDEVEQETAELEAVDGVPV